MDIKNLKNNFKVGMRDIISARNSYFIFLTLGWQDVATRYRRSRIGAFWLTVNMLVLIVVLGTVFGSIFRANVSAFLPRLTVGIIVWGFISSILNESCEAFTSSRDTILQINMPYSTHVFRVLTRNSIIFLHNVLLLPFMFIFFKISLSWNSIFSLVGILLVLINAGWVALILSIVCARFRDVLNIILNLMQVMFYITPIIWDGEMLPAKVGGYLLAFNPFYHALNIVKFPLFSDVIPYESWIIMISAALIGWIFAIIFLGKYKHRIAYWL